MLLLNYIALRTAKTQWSFGCFGFNRIILSRWTVGPSCSNHAVSCRKLSLHPHPLDFFLKNGPPPPQPFSPCSLLSPFFCMPTCLSWQPNSLFEPNHGPEVIIFFSCSTQLSMKFLLLINVKMPTIVGILTFMSMKNSIPALSDSKKS